MSHKIKKYHTTLEVPANLMFSSSIRDISRDFFRLAGFTSEWENRLKLVVDELYMNAVKYGSDSNSVIKMTFKILDHGVQFQISDEGKGIKKCTAHELKEIIKEQEQNTDITKTSGRGLSMFTKRWSDKFQILDNKDGGITMIFTKFSNSK